MISGIPLDSKTLIFEKNKSMKQQKTEHIKDESQKTGISRRSFIAMTGIGFGLVTGTTGCDGRPSGGEGWIPVQYEDKGNLPPQVRGRVSISPHNPSIFRDDQKCILCGQCADVCTKVEEVMGNYEFPVVDDILCIGCGQCTLCCPTGAITEKSGIEAMLKALADPDVHVVVQTAPSTRVALAEEFGQPVGTNVEEQQVAGLRALGADAVFDTNFTADLTIMEEAAELVKRMTGKLDAPIPMFTSCCPGWVKYCEYFYPELLPNLSTAKSPMGMLSSLIKTFYAKERGIEPKKIFSVAIMPCTAKKFEAVRPEMNNAGVHLGDKNIRDTDLVLTTRELAQLLKIKGIDLMKLVPGSYNNLMSEYSGGGAIFGATGGVMEAAVRTAYFMITGENPPESLYKLEPIRGLSGIKSAELDIPTVGKVRIAVVVGMANANKALAKIKDGSADWHFVEFMACPGGCISGGGQPKSSLPPSDADRIARSNALYTIDEKATLRLCHENQEIKSLYAGFLSDEHLPHELLHTHHYEDRSKHFHPKKSS